MILRLLALAVLLFFAYRLIRRVLHKLAPPPDTADQSPGDTQPIIPCKVCGTFVPRDRAVFDDEGQAYCSQDCRQSRTHKE